jgi:hypothetical protein
MSYGGKELGQKAGRADWTVSPISHLSFVIEHGRISITNRAGVTVCDYKNEMYVPIILERIDKK